MRTLLFAILAAVALTSSVGCQCCTPAGNGGPNYSGIVGNHHHRHHAGDVSPGGPSTSTYGYPYYTVRGPRDFLVDQPPSTGP